MPLVTLLAHFMQVFTFRERSHSNLVFKGTWNGLNDGFFHCHSAFGCFFSVLHYLWQKVVKKYSKKRINYNQKEMLDRTK